MDDTTRALLREWRRRPPERQRWPRAVGLAVVLLHLLFAAVAWIEMRPRLSGEPARVHRDDALWVRLIPAIAAPVSRRPPPLPLLPRSAQRTQRLRSPSRAPAHEPAAASGPAPAAVRRTPPPLALFDRTGQPQLPAAARSAAQTPDYVAHLPQGDTRIMRHADPLPYRATRFESAFPSKHESLLGQGIRRTLSATHTNDTKTVNLPGGVHLQCKTLLGIPTPFCQDPPAPPSRKDGDERLSMAPAAPLARQLRPRKRPTLERCIAAYRAGKPLPYGCPVDTPNRAVDAELAACVKAYRPGRPLPPGCPANTRTLAHPPAAARSSGR